MACPVSAATRLRPGHKSIISNCSHRICGCSRVLWANDVHISRGIQQCKRGVYSGQKHLRGDCRHPAHQNNPGTAQDTSLASVDSRKLLRSRRLDFGEKIATFGGSSGTSPNLATCIHGGQMSPILTILRRMVKIMRVSLNGLIMLYQWGLQCTSE
jgi:hypothetical protein